MSQQISKYALSGRCTSSRSCRHSSYCLEHVGLIVGCGACWKPQLTAKAYDDPEDRSEHKKLSCSFIADSKFLGYIRIPHRGRLGPKYSKHLTNSRYILDET